MKACHTGHYHVASELLRANANIACCNRPKQTVYHIKIKASDALS